MGDAQTKLMTELKQLKQSWILLVGAVWVVDPSVGWDFDPSVGRGFHPSVVWVVDSTFGRSAVLIVGPVSIVATSIQGCGLG